MLLEGDSARARTCFEQGLHLNRALQNDEGIVRGLAYLGEIAHAQGKAEQAARYFRESAEQHLSLGTRIDSVYHIAAAGYAFWRQGAHTRAMSVWRQGLEMARAAGDMAWVASLLNALAWCAADVGDYERALVEGGQSLELSRDHRNVRDITEMLTLLGYLANERGDYVDALCRLLRSSAGIQRYSPSHDIGNI